MMEIMCLAVAPLSGINNERIRLKEIDEMKADFHMHTSFSTDSDTAPEQMIEGAIARGLHTICITDHQDVDFPEHITPSGFRLDFETYFQTLRELQVRYKNQIEVLIGVEFGLQPHLGMVYKELAQKYPFDFIIGSVHIFDGMDPYYKGYFDDKTDEEGYERAFQITLENIKNISDYDVLGHLDYVVRYGNHQARDYSYGRYADYIDEILRYLIEHGKGLEVNTAGFKYGLDFAHPHPDILKRYKELGGEIITIGADGHKPEHIAYDFHKISAILQECGFKNYTEFRQRKPFFRQLP